MKESENITEEKAKTFNPETFGLSAPMFTRGSRLVDSIITFGKL